MRNLDLAIVLKAVTGEPGFTCAEYADWLGASRTLMGSLLRELRARGDVRSRGNTRGTRYYPRKAKR